MQFTLANDLLQPPMAAQPTANPATNPTQNLAAAVIKQAVTDATSPSVEPRVRVEARIFLAGSAAFEEWCSVAGLNPTVVFRDARVALERRGTERFTARIPCSTS